MTKGKPLAGTEAEAHALHRALIRVLRRLRRSDAALGVSPARLSALSVLVFGGPLTLSAFARAEQITLPSASRLMRELEAGGWVRRSSDRDDARALKLEATARGRRLMEQGRARRIEALLRAQAALAPADRAALANLTPALERLADALEAEARGRGGR